MKEICSNFNIIPLTDVASISNNIVLPVEGASFDTFFTEDLSLNSKPDNTDAGLSLPLSQDVVIDKVSFTVAEKYNWVRYCILVIYYTDGTFTIYGSDQYPVEVYISPGIQRDILTISMQTPVIPLI